ncbi:MAG: sensor histidine kinase [Lachnospiraceae bacterium]|nr:sensor histidine kinase [Lachnospiraceae bacterium]
MLITLEHFIIDLLYVIKILIICIGVINMPFKKSNKSVLRAFILLIISSTIKWSIYENQALKKWLLLFTLISMIILMQCLLIIKKIKGTLFFLLLFFMNENLDKVINTIFFTLTGNDNSLTIEKINIYSNITSLIFWFIFLLSCRKKIKGNYLCISTFKLIYLLMYSVINFVFLKTLLIYLKKLDLITKEKIFTFLIMCIALEMYLQIYFYIFECINLDFYKNKNYINNSLLAANKKQIEYLQEKEEATRRFRHDLNSHIYTLKSLCEKRNWKSMNQYIRRINQENIKRNDFLQTGNGVVDAICNLYMEKAQKENISIVFSGNIPNRINIEDFDLCVIFTNLLSNAIEAVRFGDNKDILLEIKYNENNIYIREKNYFTIPIKCKENKFLTIKKDSYLHGFGIQNLEESVNRYGGYVQIETENRIWKINICIPYVLLEN